MRKKTFAQQLKDEFKENNRFHQQSMDLRRNAQSLIRQADAMLAPRLSPKFLFDCLFTIPRVGIVDALRRKESLGGLGLAKEILTSFSQPYWLALQHVATWAAFWIGMLFRWLFDELGNALRSATYRILTVLAALLGVWLVFEIIIFVLSH